MSDEKLKEMGHLQTGIRNINPNIIVTDDPQKLEPTGNYTSKKVGEIRSGDRVNWWTDDVEVRGVKQRKNKIFITVFDPRSGKKGEERTFSYSVTDELLVRNQSNET